MEGTLVADKNYVSEISNVEKGLKGLNAELAKMEAGLKRVSGLAGVTFGNVKGILSSNVGQGNSLGLGTSNAAFGSTAGAGGMGGVMPWLYSKAGAKAVGGVQLGLGLAGGAYAAAPDFGMVMARASGYYTAAQRGFGTTRAGVAAATFGALRGGITGLGEDVAASNMLTLGYNYNPGGSSYLQAMGEVGGLARAYNMANATAAQAIGGLHTGAMGSTLYQAGIRTIDPRTGQTRSTEDIARQLYQRTFRGQKGLTAQDIEISMREGMAGASLRAMGFSESQMQIFSQAFTNFAQGKGFDVANMSGEGNPMFDIYRGNTSQTALAERATEPYIAGLGTATDALVRLNQSLQGLPDAFFALKGGLQAFSGTNMGAGISAAAAGIGSAVGTGLTYKALQSILGGGSKAAGAAAGTAAKIGIGTLGKGIPVLGGALSAATGQGFLSTVAIGAGVGAMFGGGVPGALVGGGLSALGYGVTKLFNSENTGSKNPPVLTGNQTETSWATALLTRIGAPVTDQNVSAMTTWMKFEGGGGGKATGLGKNSAMYNPLNTTQGAAGAKSMNSVGVKSYNSWDQGMEATVQTLMNGKYSGILSALQQGTSTAGVLSAVNASPWGTKIPGYAAGNPSTGGAQTVNITLKIDKASDAEAIAFAKRVKSLLEKDQSLSMIGSK